MNKLKLFKTCKVCQRNFTWRKKWRKDWNNVIYCSEKCRRTSKSKKIHSKNFVN